MGLPVQIPLKAIPGGVQLENGLVITTVERPEPAPEPAKVDPRQDFLPLTGIKPGASWRRDRGQPGRPELEPEQLTMALCGVHRHRMTSNTRSAGRPWSSNDEATMDELGARSWTAVDVGLRYSTPVPKWFAGVVPRHLKPLISLVWSAYEAGTFGCWMTVPQLAAELEVSERTVRRYRSEAQRLGLLRAIITWRRCPEHDGCEQDANLYRIGPALEALAGITAFERDGSDAPPRRRGLSRSAARKRGAALRQAARVHRHAAEGVVWRASPRARRAPRGGARSAQPAPCLGRPNGPTTPRPASRQGEASKRGPGAPTPPLGRNSLRSPSSMDLDAPAPGDNESPREPSSSPTTRPEGGAGVLAQYSSDDAPPSTIGPPPSPDQLELALARWGAS
ncbi:MAG: hypothetical protein K0U78_16270 [Actinomycetia bacterium]|nr:hypothetical protein [Actinomycetes bacterium]